MTPDWIIHACLLAGLSSALVAGVFQSFSDFVMRGLVMATPASGAQSMQMINRTVFRSVFVILLLGLGPVSLALAAYAYFVLAGAGAMWLIAAAAIYLPFVILVTIAGNVPMNERLDRMDHAAEDTVAYWETYGRVWTRWNHVRTLGSLAAAICYLMAAMAFA
ncbi:MAG: anthrone oxygenase family protein [Pseudomonadota bacterium]